MRDGLSPHPTPLSDNLTGLEGSVLRAVRRFETRENGWAGEPTHRPDSVGNEPSPARPVQPSICARRCRHADATYPQTQAGNLSGSRCQRPTSARSPSRGSTTFLVLLQVGFTQPPRSPDTLVVSYTTVSPLPALRRVRRSRWRSVSVALSRESPRVGVTHHLALRSPDLPRLAVGREATAGRGRPVGSPASRVYRRGLPHAQRCLADGDGRAGRERDAKRARSRPAAPSDLPAPTSPEPLHQAAAGGTSRSPVPRLRGHAA